jgi:hypothetical protein
VPQQAVKAVAAAAPVGDVRLGLGASGSRECWKGNANGCLVSGGAIGVLAHPRSSSGVIARGSSMGLLGSSR